MLLPVMREVRNFFEISSESGEYEIKNGSITVTGRYVVGQYVAITGSILNDGVKRVESVKDGVISFTIPRAEYPDWKQPTGSHDAYMIDDRVTHGSDRWISLIDYNVYLPGSDPRWWEKLHDSPEEHTTVDEIFNGTIYGLRVPHDFVALCDEIVVFTTESKPTGFVSESIGSYSYSRATDKNGAPASWKTVFVARLIPFRRMFTSISI